MKCIGDIIEVFVLVSFLIRLVVTNLGEEPVDEEKAKSTSNHSKKQVTVIELPTRLFSSLPDRCIHR